MAANDEQGAFRGNRAEASKWVTSLLRTRTKDGWPITEDFCACVQALEGWLPENQAGFVLAALERMLANGETSLEAFEKRVHECKEDKLKERQKIQVQEWTFIIPFQIKFQNNPPPKFQVRGVRFEFFTSQQTSKKIGKPKNRPYDLRMDRILCSEPYQSYIVFRSKAYDKSAAWRKVHEQFETLLGIFEFTLNFGINKAHHGQDNPAHTHFPRPKWVISYSDQSGPQLQWFLTEYGNYKELPTKALDDKQTLALIKNGAPFRKIAEKNSIERLIDNGLILYAQALDGRLPHARLLGLWQMAEALTLSERSGGRTDVVCNRLLVFDSLFCTCKSALKAALLRVAKRRNDVVHRGERYVVKENHEHTLKLAVESFLYHLIAYRKKIRTQNALEQYFNIHARNKSEFQALKDALRLTKLSSQGKLSHPPQIPHQDE
jgi:hypothetical protein